MSHLRNVGLAIMFLSCLAAGCSAASPDSASEPVERALTPAYEELGRAFGSLIDAHDYEGAYAYIAESSRSGISYSEFEETFRNYRESVGETLTVKIVAGEPYDKGDPDALLPDEIRDRVEDEFAIHFEPEGDEEGFSAIVWVFMEADQAKIGHFFVGD